MSAFVPDSEMTRDGDLADWRAFCLAYYEPIARALRLFRVPEGELDELAHEFILKAAEKNFLDSYHAFQKREAEAGRRAKFRNYLYRSLRNHVYDARRKQTTRSKEVGLRPEAAGVLAAAPERLLGPDAIHALDVLHQALQAFRRHCERTGKPHLWVFFEETFLADEFRDRRGKTRAELLAEYQLDDSQLLDNALTTAKRAFRRFIEGVIPHWPGDDLEPSERFADWMATLRDSNASQFNLLHLAYRVTPFLGDASQAASTAMVVSEPLGAILPNLVYEEPALALNEEELSIFLSFRLEMSLTQMLDAAELKPYVPSDSPFFPRPNSRFVTAGSRAPSIPRRPLCLLTLIEPTEAETEALAGVDVVGLLVRLKSLAKQLRHSTNHALPDVFAEVIYTTVNVLALVRYQATIHSIGSTRLASNIRLYLGQPWLDDRLRPLFLSGLAVIEGPA